MNTMLAIFVSLFTIGYVQGFAKWMTNDFCDRQLIVGEIIMNEAVISSDERSVKLFRKNQELKSGDLFAPGEELKIQISDTSKQYLFETINSKIAGGGCDGRRIADKNNVVVTMPTGDDATREVSFWAGWAVGHSVVSVSEPFVLKPGTDSDLPKVLTHRSQGRSVVGKTKSPVEEDDIIHVDDAMELKEVVKVKVVGGRMTSREKGLKKVPKTVITEEDLKYDKEQNSESNLRGKAKKHPSSVDSPSVFESRPAKKVYDAAKTPSAGQQDIKLVSRGRGRMNRGAGGRDTEVQSSDAEADSSEEKAAGGDDGQADRVEKVRRTRRQKKLDQETHSIFDLASHFQHVSVTTMELYVLVLIAVIFVGTVAFQMWTGKFRFQLAKQVHKIRGQGKQFEE